MFANEGSNQSYPFIGVPEGHHDLSHHGGDPKKHEKIKKINRFHIEQFAYLLGKLKSIREGDGTLLDNSMIVYGSGIGDGNRHNHDDLPILLAGKGGGTIKTGRHVKYPTKTPLNNLYLSMLDRIGAPVESLGDSTGRGSPSSTVEGRPGQCVLTTSPTAAPRTRRRSRPRRPCPGYARVGRRAEVDHGPVGELRHLPGVVQVVVLAEREAAVEDDVAARVERVRVDQDQGVVLGVERPVADLDLLRVPRDRQLVGDPS